MPGKGKGSHPDLTAWGQRECSGATEHGEEVAEVSRHQRHQLDIALGAAHNNSNNS